MSGSLHGSIKPFKHQNWLYFETFINSGNTCWLDSTVELMSALLRQYRGTILPRRSMHSHCNVMSAISQSCSDSHTTSSTMTALHQAMQLQSIDHEISQQHMQQHLLPVKWATGQLRFPKGEIGSVSNLISFFSTRMVD